MENTSRIFSLILGLVFVIFLFAVITGKLTLKNKFPYLAGPKATITPTPTPKDKMITIQSISESPSSSSDKTPTNQYKSKNNQLANANQKYNGIKTIPETGTATILLPLVFSTLLVGIYLKKKS